MSIITACSDLYCSDDLLVGSHLQAYDIVCESGAYNLTGSDTTLTHLQAFDLTASSGSYNLTGSDTTLTHTTVGAFNLIADGGSYSLSGTPVTLTHTEAVKLTASSGSYTLTGSDTTLTHLQIFDLEAESGAFTVQGSDISLTHAIGGEYTLALDTGTYAITGGTTNLNTTAQDDTNTLILKELRYFRSWLMAMG